MIAAATNNSSPMASWIFRRGQRATTPAPRYAPVTAEAIMLDQSGHIHLDQSDVDERLGQRGQRVTDIEGARDVLVSDHPPQLEE